MSSSSFLMKLCDPGCWTVGFFCLALGEACSYPDIMFIHLTSHPPLRKFLGRIKMVFHNVTDFNNLSNFKRSLCKKHWGDTLIYRFLPGIWLHTQREDGPKTCSLWSPHRNRRSHNDALWKHIRWRYRLLWHCFWCSSRGYISLAKSSL